MRARTLLQEFLRTQEHIIDALAGYPSSQDLLRMVNGLNLHVSRVEQVAGRMERMLGTLEHYLERLPKPKRKGGKRR